MNDRNDINRRTPIIISKLPKINFCWLDSLSVGFENLTFDFALLADLVFVLRFAMDGIQNMDKF